MKIEKVMSDQNSVRILTDQGQYGFYAVYPEIIRAVWTKSNVVLNESLIIRPETYKNNGYLEVAENESDICMEAGRVTAEFSKTTGCCIWKRNGQVLFKEAFKDLTETDVVHYTTEGAAPVVKRVKTVDGERSFIENLKMKKDRTAYRARLGFTWADDEAVYGLGQGEEGIYNYRHHQQYLYQHNMRIPIPMLVSSRLYGVLTDCCSLLTFNEEAGDAYLFLDTVDQLDYYVMAGDSMDDVVRGFRRLTGTAAMLPKWAYGYVQSKEQYYTADELLRVAEEYRRRKIPLDCIVQDWNTWEPGIWGEKKLDPARYANIKEVNQKLHEMNVHTMVSVWPNMAEGGSNHQEFVDTNHILGDYSTYDAFDEEARAIYWRQAKEGLFDAGFDSWWCDSTEPFSGPDWGGMVKREPWERFELVGKEHKKYIDASKANAFALMHAKGIFENQRKDRPDKRVLNLTRSGYAAQQQYGVVLWSGDIAASWDTLKKQIPEGLNMCLSGMPYWTLDIGAFFVVGSAWQNRGCGNHTNPDPLWFWTGRYNDGVADKGYCELYARWFEYGTFLPMQRSHGTDTPREIWNFGEPGTCFYDVIEKYIHLRYRLMPYIYSLAGMVTLEDYTIMRSLIFDFPEDEKVKNIGNQYMFGPSLLICPVTEPMYYEAGNKEINREKVWTCYLPAGTKWYHYWTNQSYEGGQSVTVPAPLGEMPIFVKAGSIIPVLQEEIQYAAQQPKKPVEVMVYPGEDCYFTLYEDGGDDYGYENGAYARTDLIWKEAGQELVIGKRVGTYPGMDEKPVGKWSGF